MGDTPAPPTERHAGLRSDWPTGERSRQPTGQDETGPTGFGKPPRRKLTLFPKPTTSLKPQLQPPAARPAPDCSLPALCSPPSFAGGAGAPACRPPPQARGRPGCHFGQNPTFRTSATAFCYPCNDTFCGLPDCRALTRASCSLLSLASGPWARQCVARRRTLHILRCASLSGLEPRSSPAHPSPPQISGIMLVNIYALVAVAILPRCGCWARGWRARCPDLTPKAP